MTITVYITLNHKDDGRDCDDERDRDDESDSDDERDCEDNVIGA